MTRNKVITLFITAVIVLIIAVAPIAVGRTIHTAILTHLIQGGCNSSPAGTVMPVFPYVLACEGCSGGGGGPV